MWPFVGDKQNKQGLWLTIDRDNQSIVAAHIADRGISGAQGLWASMPPHYRDKAHCYTDYWEAYQAVIPSEQHDVVGKHTGLKNHIESLNLTMSLKAHPDKPFFLEENSKIILGQFGTLFITTIFQLLRRFNHHLKKHYLLFNKNTIGIYPR
jgi:insertion element IS1 protein InsB